MIKFPLPGDELERVVMGDDGLHVVASDYFTDDVAVVLVTYPRAPHFCVFNIDLTGPLGKGTPQGRRVANIGTAVAMYADNGGTVNDIDPTFIPGTLR